MANIFRQNQNQSPKLKRSRFDQSFKNNTTLRIGAITPLACFEVIGGDTFNIDCNVGIQLMPTVFPIQTDLDFIVHGYYVRSRALMDDWKDFYFMNKQVEQPYLKITPSSIDRLATGSLADHLGVPTAIASVSDSYMSLPAPVMYSGDRVTNVDVQSMTSEPPGEPAFKVEDLPLHVDPVTTTMQPISANLASRRNACFTIHVFASDHETPAEPYNVGKYQYEIATSSLPLLSNHTVVYSGTEVLNIYGFNFADKKIPCGTQIKNRTFTLNTNNYTPSVPASKNYLIVWIPTDNNQFADSKCAAVYPVSLGNGDVCQLSADDLVRLNGILAEHSAWFSLGSTAFSDPTTDRVADTAWCGIVNGMLMQISGGEVTDAINFSQISGANPFVSYGDNPPKIPLNALPFRAYEMICNYHFRNERINPLVINGVTEYNKFLPNTGNGADTFNYQLHYRNWEDDYFTSCLFSPQDGEPALVGVSATGTFHFKDQNNVEYTMKCESDTDGTLTGINSYSNDLPIGTVRRMTDLISYGISINDFRNVNSFQRWKERNIRRGYKYVDQMLSHFGVAPKYNEMNVPEFIGGMHTKVQMEKITNLAQSEDAALGQFCGQGRINGRTKHTMHKFCDEPGYIMIVGMLVPRPVYSQSIKKYLVKRHPLDYYFPEFTNIGNQPVYNYELAPLQASLEDALSGDPDSNKLFQVFGYQRPFADYIASYDEVHGQFRTTLQDYIMSRIFDETPQLGKDFIQINPEAVNNVFSIGESLDDKVIGQVAFRVYSKRPIPRFSNPRLE